MKKVTLKDIAKVANVSYTTVSRALAGSPEISEQTRHHICQISQDMGYIPAAHIRPLPAGRRKSIGLLVNNFQSSFTSEVAYYVEEQAWAQGYGLLLSHTIGDRRKHGELYKLLVEKEVEGIIVMPSNAMVYEDLLPFLDKTPTIFINENLKDLPESYVTIDNYKGGFMGTDYLHGLGHKKIIYCGRKSNKMSRELRLQGYLDACEQHGLEPTYIEYPYMANSMQCGYLIGKELFSNPLACTAIFAATDSTAIGIMQAGMEVGIRVPEDLSLMGFDNIRFSSFPGISLTTIDQPKQVIATIAVNMLLEKIQFPAIESAHRLLVPSLIERGSCAHI